MILPIPGMIFIFLSEKLLGYLSLLMNVSKRKRLQQKDEADILSILFT